MENRKPLAETFATAGNLLFWFVKKVNFKFWSLLFSPRPSPQWKQWHEITLRTFQLIFAVPVFVLDLLIILIAVILFIISVFVILICFIAYAIVIKLLNIVLDKAVSPILKIFAIVAGFTTLLIIYEPTLWVTISSRLSEFYSLLF